MKMSVSSVSVRSVFRSVTGIVAILACAAGVRAQTGKTIQGPCRSVFGAQVCTSYRTVSGVVTAFTMRVPIAVIEQAPPNAPMAMPPKPDVEVPFASAVEKQIGFTYANIYWNAHGHPPAVYEVPHFDFHFYLIPAETTHGIDCKDMTQPQSIPAGYVLPPANGTCVPAMGTHAAPLTDFNPKVPWKGSLIVGYYGGKLTFFEPMITRALLLQKHSFSYPVPQIAPSAHIRYPKQFNAVYLPKIAAYDFTFSY